MKFIKAILLLLALVFLISSISCSKERNSLDIQLDNLEVIIEKYEHKFRKYEYSTQAYNDMVLEYNQEITEWGSSFENDRYERGSDNKKVPKQEFKDVEKRFYELNDRMTRMVLASIPKAKEYTPEN